MMSRKLPLLSLAAFLFISSYSQEKKPAVISGMVKDARTKLPLAEAVITLSSNAFDGQKFALTDSTGMYRISNLPAGIYAIVFEMEGYHKFTQDSIAVKEGSSLGISFQMAKEHKGRQKEEEPVKDSINYEVKLKEPG